MSLKNQRSLQVIGLLARKAIKSLPFLACLTLLFNCIQEIEVFKGSNPTLVVDGSITDQPGPHKVELSYSTTYNTPPSYERVETATVRILDDLGNVQLLSYAGNGVFQTPAEFAGIVGRSYSVEVILQDGEEYRSEPEELLPVAPIDQLRYEVVGTEIVYSIDFTDQPDQKNFYRWRYKGTYEVRAPIAYTLFSKPGTLPIIPLQCYSGGVRPASRSVWQCWLNEFDLEYLKIDSDLLFDGRTMTNYPITSMELDRKFDRGYQLEVSQYSLTPQAHKYWKAISDQIGNNGTIFETANYQIRGNIRSTSDSDRLVLGYFSASAVSKASVSIFEFVGNFGDVECNVNQSGCYPQRCLDCLKFGAAATNVKPAGWPE